MEVTEGNTELPSKSLLIKGYDVSGYVKSNGLPVKDVILLLYPHENVSFNNFNYRTVRYE